MTTTQIVLASRPLGMPTLDNFKFAEMELPVVGDGEVMLESMYYSIDPYMRGRMNDEKSYTPPFQVGKPITGTIVASVAESQSPFYKKGDVVVGMLPWQKKMIAPEDDLQKINVAIAPPSYFLGLLGITGLTAYFGLLDIGKPQMGETVVISGAAGAVGIVAGQIAKLLGCRVVGIAGSDKKIKLLKDEFGFDDGINYKTSPDMAKAIAVACPDGVDVYFDNVGGAISDAVISHINFYARIVLCGQIALYNSTKVPTGPRIQPMLLTRSVLMQGFIVSNYKSQFPEAIQKLEQWLSEGKLKGTETMLRGFDALPKALIGLFSGNNTGKMIVEA
ncbi:NADP-dependent oxidoreductase [Parasediminibacterium sp. JCM 36343]|uniref:NADP-dependent oxidoreductase n=1 Tax=Parasediminibacterium sp. JCM 36343 TaxID=3374279 RepID=UPI00397DE521